ncbi:MAG: DUF4198 domain-containing protein [Caldimicrobium sp.]|nr:DUF4198 domain-containing protein [Caldimicrobium sp.]MCX7874207.1 DUF4198 domain-containing protein [Caldimicrobium sp.]
MGVWLFLILWVWGLKFGSVKEGWGHEVNYRVKEDRAICISFFFGLREPMAFAEIEVFPPGDAKTPYVKGRTDSSGIFCFLPKEAGLWRVVAKADTEHGPHGAQLKINISEAGNIVDYTKPLIAEHQKFFIIVGIAGWFVGLGGIFLYLQERKRITRTKN